MKILSVIFHFPPISGGGVIVAVELLNNFAKLGHEVTVVTPQLDWQGPKYEPKIDPRIQIVRVDVPSKSKIKVAARRCKKSLQKKAEELGEENNYDFVFTIFHPFHLAPSAAVSCAKKLGIPSIVKVDDAIFEKSSGIKSIQRKVEKIMNTKTLQNASHILLVNNETRKTVTEYYNISDERISIVPNGVNLTLFQQKRSNNSRSILFSGAMYHHRGIDELLETVPTIIKNIPDAKIILLGQGPEMEKLKQIVKEKEISKNVIFRGWIDRNQIPNELANAAVGIGPLKLTTVTKNALPIKVLEYMAAGLPIIAKSGTLPDDVLQNEKNGFFIDSTDELAEKLVLLLKDPKLNEQMGKKSIEMVQKFSWKNVANSILEIQKTLKRTR